MGILEHREAFMIRTTLQRVRLENKLLIYLYGRMLWINHKSEATSVERFTGEAIHADRTLRGSAERGWG